MIKTLRYSLLSLLVLVCGSVFAQKETLWAENFSSYAANEVPAPLSRQVVSTATVCSPRTTVPMN